ncbi:MAG: peptide deformylase [Anaerolineae bacterium]|nr:peptide deformylase [Anaerolineae bacterium]
MALRDIVTLGSPEATVLRRRAKRVTRFDDELCVLLDDMVETLLDAPGVGLAAPQIDVSQRVIVVRLPQDEAEYGEQAGVLYEVVNPQIARASEEMVDGVEACLSIPGYFGSVMRHEAVTVKGQDRYGKKIRVKAQDWLARVFQHEIDHLDGVLFIDRAEEIWSEEELQAEAAQAEPAAAGEDPYATQPMRPEA